MVCLIGLWIADSVTNVPVGEMCVMMQTECLDQVEWEQVLSSGSFSF